MNERTHFFIKIYLSHFILERFDVGCVWEMSWRQGGTVILTHSSSDHSSTSSLAGVAQSWVTEGPKPSVSRWFSRGHLVSNWLQLVRTAWCTWLYNCLTSTSFRCSSAYLHRCIPWLTARVRVNMLNKQIAGAELNCKCYIAIFRELVDFDESDRMIKFIDFFYIAQSAGTVEHTDCFSRDG